MFKYCTYTDYSLDRAFEHRARFRYINMGMWYARRTGPPSVHVTVHIASPD